ncbi:DNA/RNA non-specific endonuclease [Microbacterium sp. zg.B48]|uniref:DNA/RNA non-specific endonuclease n=1 Tax=Microbacterium sp. zg.B48 TaxID=2969408 RepID=UPI00214AB7B2|nr:DNA/RNA non-specific endonuclease [Microbacterium sp. zg.B48]MCR2762625.1 DNA/RNA non-specific endonuclease [Microbacterium sp. zg.B48]
MSAGARAVMRELKQSVADAGRRLSDRLPQLADRITDHLDNVVRQVRDTDKYANTVTTRGPNTKTTHFDPDTGRPVQEQGKILEDFGGSARGDNATAIGRLGNPGDDGGHLGAHRFFGDTRDEGIVPQIANLNRGAWKKMESEWADWVAEGARVDYRIQVDPPGAVRPDNFQVVYVVSDPSTGDIIEVRNPSFANVNGETFDRIHTR